MTLLYDVVVVLHLLGMAALVGGYLGVLVRRPPVPAPDLLMVWGARLQVLTGLALVGVAEAALDGDVDHARVAVKLVVAIVVAALAETGSARGRRGATVSPALLHGAGALAVVNVLVAVLWG
ncbi:hypothetical protein [Ornithinicoccus halotolerans]|uniref:hypothetical protein n=1 Tax=Ornithinicoccus halotolerans TaxID=1748220 RepID=UPI001297DD96|nr:hypothetical protein [Ornithinicoccus halotolerans]